MNNKLLYTLLAIILVLLVLILLWLIVFDAYYLSMRQRSITEQRLLNTNSLEWIPYNNVMIANAFGFSSLNDCEGKFVYNGVLPMLFNTSLTVQSYSPGHTDEIVEFGLFKNCSPDPVNEIYVQSYCNDVPTQADSSNSITNTVAVSHGDVFSIKFRYFDARSVQQNTFTPDQLPVIVRNLKLVFY